MDIQEIIDALDAGNNPYFICAVTNESEVTTSACVNPGFMFNVMASLGKAANDYAVLDEEEYLQEAGPLREPQGSANQVEVSAS